jgi:hypothetical protein
MKYDVTTSVSTKCWSPFPTAAGIVFVLIGEIIAVEDGIPGVVLYLSSGQRLQTNLDGKAGNVVSMLIEAQQKSDAKTSEKYK